MFWGVIANAHGCTHFLEGRVAAFEVARDQTSIAIAIDYLVVRTRMFGRAAVANEVALTVNYTLVVMCVVHFGLPASLAAEKISSGDLSCGRPV